MNFIGSQKLQSNVDSVNDDSSEITFESMDKNNAALEVCINFLLKCFKITIFFVKSWYLFCCEDRN